MQMATIYKRGNSWFCQIRRRGFPKQNRTFDTKNDALAWAAEVEQRMRSGRFVDTTEAERTTLDEALDRYLREISPAKKGHKQEIYRANTIRRSKLVEFALANIRGTDIAAYRDERLLSVKPATVNNELILLSHVFTVCIKEWGMESLVNPVSKVRRPKLPKGRDRRLRAGEEDKLLQNAQSLDLKVCIILALETGMRRGEIADLLWEHFDSAAQVLHIPDTKNDDARDIPLSTRARDAILLLPRRIDGQLFGFGSENLGDRFKFLTEKLGIEDLHFHDLRHEATSRLFERGLAIEEVAKITGHKTWAMLRRYTHLNATTLAKKLG